MPRRFCASFLPGFESIVLSVNDYREVMKAQIQFLNNNYHDIFNSGGSISEKENFVINCPSSMVSCESNSICQQQYKILDLPFTVSTLPCSVSSISQQQRNE